MTPEEKRKAEIIIRKAINENPGGDKLVEGGLGIVNGKVVCGADTGSTVRELQTCMLEGGQYYQAMEEFVTMGYGTLDQALEKIVEFLNPPAKPSEVPGPKAKRVRNPKPGNFNI